MKSSLPPTAIHKRLYNVLPRSANPASPLPRPRSNSASLHTNSSLLPLTFFDTPPPPSSRLPPPHSPRVPQETKPHNSHHANPNPYALTPSRPSNHDSLQPLTASLPYGYQPSPHFSSSQLNHPHAHTSPPPPLQKRHKHRYHLDVGAYGIPKRSRCSHRAYTSHGSLDHSHLSVQIGEDAYFVRDNAMGVADGVGGWARSSSSTSAYSPADHSGLTPSAVFARRLMHFTSKQLEEAEYGEPVEDLDSHLEDLADGIDVLQILERAYDQTVSAHVAPETKTPLHTGSSTALVAVLDQLPATQHDQEHHADVSEEETNAILKIAHVGDCMGMLVRGDEIAWRSEEMWWAWNTPVQLAPPRSPPTPAPQETSQSLPPPSTLASLIASTSNFLSNPLFAAETSTHTPFDPPPAPSAASSSDTKRSAKATATSEKVTPTPRNSAQILTVPVRPDDILILASDGLSDNLWDEDVLDEVVRFRKLYDAGVAARVDRGESGIRTRTEVRHGAIVASASTVDKDEASSSSHTSYTPPIPIRSTDSSRTAATLRRHTLAAMLSEALCSRAGRVSERRTCGVQPCFSSGDEPSLSTSSLDDETPFSRRAKEVGKTFEGGKRDDISVLVAIVAPSNLDQVQ